MSRRASLPGADELFRRTTGAEATREAPAGPMSSRQAQKPPSPPVEKATNLQVAETAKKKPRHEEKVTFYCTPEDLMGLERARLALRAQHGIAADRGKIVRMALAYVLEDFEARADDSILLRKLSNL